MKTNKVSKRVGLVLAVMLVVGALVGTIQISAKSYMFMLQGSDYANTSNFKLVRNKAYRITTSGNIVMPAKSSSRTITAKSALEEKGIALFCVAYEKKKVKMPDNKNGNRRGKSYQFSFTPGIDSTSSKYYVRTQISNATSGYTTSVTVSYKNL